MILDTINSRNIKKWWKKSPYFLILLMAFYCSKPVQPKGEITTKKVEIKNFSHLKLSGKFRLFYIKNDENFVDVETYPSVFENLKIENKGDTLFILEKKPTEKVDFYNLNVYTKSKIQSISISDSVEMNTNNAIETEKLRLNLQHHGKFIGEIQSKETLIQMKNLSLMNAKGYAKNVYLSISDTANFLSPYFLMENLNLTAENQTYTEVNVKDTLKGNIKNTSKLLYYNNPVRDFKIDEKAIVNHQKLN